MGKLIQFPSHRVVYNKPQPDLTEQEALEIKQHKFIEQITEQLTLEIPGGMVDEGEDPNSRLPGFIMMHIAQIYTRLDLALAEIEDLQDAPVPEEQEKEAADRAALKETRKKLQQCKDQLARELDRAPSNEELAKEMGVELELVESLVAV